MRYFIVDTGKEMIDLAGIITQELKNNHHHFIEYLTTEPYYLAVEEVNEDAFLEHYKNTNHGKA